MKNAIFLIYFLFLLSFSFLTFLYIDPNLVYLERFYTDFAYKNKELITVIYLLFVIGFFVFYFLFLKLEKLKSINLKDIKKLIILTITGLFVSYPAILSYDIFNYILTSKVLYFYKENPYIVMPIEFIGDPYLVFTRAANKIALYGYSWITLSSVPFFLGFGNFILTIFSFKLFILLFYIGTLILIWKMSKSTLSLILFAFNPLVIIETLVSSHNDIVVVFFALMAFYLLMRKKIMFAMPVLMFSILIKYSTLFLIPVFLFTVYKMLKKEKIDWENTFYISFFSMLLIFFLSPLREEIYSWYAIWFLVFISLVPKKKFILSTSIVFSFGLLLRYIPYMFTGTYIGITPVAKTALTFIPPVLFSIYYGIKKKI